MTGFAASEVTVGSYRLDWETRSVNHRYLDLGFRLPDEFRSLEPKLRRRAGQAVKRGKVDCTLRLSRTGAEHGDADVDRDQLGILVQLERTLLDESPEREPLSVHEILRWPGILKSDEKGAEALLEPALAAFDEAMEALRAAREREGARLGEMLRERLAAIETLLTNLDDQLLVAAPRHRDKLLERIAKLDIEANPERLEQELAFIAQRVDVSEEADRLKGHLAEIRDVLDLAEPVGRRLDFLIQELNREANTLASKVQDDDLARRAVDLKVLIEQMREQAQNIE